MELIVEWEYNPESFIQFLKDKIVFIAKKFPRNFGTYREFCANQVERSRRSREICANLAEIFRTYREFCANPGRKVPRSWKISRNNIPELQE